MKVGDLVKYNQQPGFVFGPDEYGVGLILEEEAWDEDNGSVFIVWWPEYIHGSVEFDHEEIDLILVPKEE